MREIEILSKVVDERNERILYDDQIVNRRPVGMPQKRIHSLWRKIAL